MKDNFVSWMIQDTKKRLQSFTFAAVLISGKVI
jgi:hypothetical protein